MTRKGKGLTFVGVGSNGEPIIDGGFIFWLMDSMGVPLEIMNDILATKGMGFDVIGFCKAALDSGNWSPETLKRRLSLAYEGPNRDTFEANTDIVLAGLA